MSSQVAASEPVPVSFTASLDISTDLVAEQVGYGGLPASAELAIAPYTLLIYARS